MLALIEKRFLSTGGNNSMTPAHLTLRDQYANAPEDLFDFSLSPSQNASVTQA